jgi:uncharacterized Ntn-hydrolase superfamily protein
LGLTLKTMKKLAIFIFLIISAPGFSQGVFSKEPLAHTYSIVAIDPETGDMGVAVQSHWFSVGTVVAWGEPGVGVVATQSFVNVSFGRRGLALLKSGMDPQDALDSLLKTDEGKDVRQVAILNSNGKVAVHTGKSCIKDAGHQKGMGYSVQANMMTNDKVWPAMSKAFENSKGPLAERLLNALEAAQNAGGDIRGKQSAALYVFRAKPTGNEWEDKLVDLRIDDHADPIKELGRLLKTHRAYEHMNRGDLAVEKNDMKLAMEEYSAAEALFPQNEEMKFWHAVTLVNIGRIDESLPLFGQVFTQNKSYKILLPRLIDSKLLTVDSKQLEKILKQPVGKGKTIKN